MWLSKVSFRQSARKWGWRGTLTTNGRVCRDDRARIDFVEVVVTKGHQAEMWKTQTHILLTWFWQQYRGWVGRGQDCRGEKVARRLLCCPERSNFNRPLPLPRPFRSRFCVLLRLCSLVLSWTVYLSLSLTSCSVWIDLGLFRPCSPVFWPEAGPSFLPPTPFLLFLSEYFLSPQ